MAVKGQEKPNLAGFCHMSQQPTLQEKTQRAFRAYATLVDTADWLKTELRGPLELFDLTVREFRLMEVLYRDGALPIADVAVRRKMGRSNLHKMIRTLSRRGWVRQAMVTLPPVEFTRAHLPEARRNEPRKGRRIAVVGLTKPGKKYMKDVLAEAFEIGPGFDEGARRARAGITGANLREAAQGRRVEVSSGDQDEGTRDLRLQI